MRLTSCIRDGSCTHNLNFLFVRFMSGNFLNVCMFASRGRCSFTNVLYTLAEFHECLGCVSRDVHETYVCWGLLSLLPAA